MEIPMSNIPMRALVTGFAPYGGRGLNPAAEVALAPNGSTLGSLQIKGVGLPVSLSQAPHDLADHIRQWEPDITLCLGLWPGEPMIRLERVALNCADFEIPDGTGHFACNQPVVAGGPDGLGATLPLGEALEALLRQGIPARLSGTAGTFLCNATMYSALHHARLHRPAMLAGFVHLPYLPAQVATLLTELRDAREMELHQRADLASMDLQTMLAAVNTILAVSAGRVRR
jgi:pyroglutamyl-peptidase